MSSAGLRTSLTTTSDSQLPLGVDFWEKQLTLRTPDNEYERPGQPWSQHVHAYSWPIIIKQISYEMAFKKPINFFIGFYNLRNYCFIKDA